MANLSIVGKQTGDYFKIECKACGSATKNEYLGGDHTVPHFKATCPKCGTSGEWKLSGPDWSGLL